jgi:hypothetical protein
MELAVATRKARTRSALTAASWQLLLLIAFSYGIAYVFAACINSASAPVSEEPRSSTSVQTSGFNLHAALVCESAAPRLWERSACSLPK